jgi:uncharacterized protein DUF5677
VGGHERLIPGSADALKRLLGSPVDIGGITTETNISKLEGVVFELYKEVIAVLVVVSHILDESAAAKNSLPRNQAICVGLMVRIVKFMIAVTQLSAKDDRGEVVFALNRSVMESSINLEFLVRTSEERYFDQFVEFSLGPERELYDIIQANIATRGGEVWPIKRRMLSSISRVCRASGLRIEDVERKHRDWGENLRDRLKVLTKEELYVGMVRMPSHAVHGTWVDLFMRHLRYDEKSNVFRPNPEWSPADARLLGPVAVFVLDAAQPYVERFFPKMPEIELLIERISGLRDRILQVDAAHEKLMSEGKAT